MIGYDLYLTEFSGFICLEIKENWFSIQSPTSYMFDAYLSFKHHSQNSLIFLCQQSTPAIKCLFLKHLHLLCSIQKCSTVFFSIKIHTIFNGCRIWIAFIHAFVYHMLHILFNSTVLFMHLFTWKWFRNLMLFR